MFCKRHRPSVFFNASELLPSILKSTERCPSGPWMMRRPSTFRELVLLHVLLQANTIMISKNRAVSIRRQQVSADWAYRAEVCESMDCAFARPWNTVFQCASRFRSRP